LGAPLRILFEDREGRQRDLPFAEAEVSVGRAPGSALQLGGRNVSRRHARFVRQNGAVFVEDLGSSNGTRVNGERIGGRRRIRPGDLVQIGDWDLALEGSIADAPAEAQLPPPPPSPSAAPAPPAPAAAPPRAAAPRPEARGAWRSVAAIAAVALCATLVGYAAGRALRAPPPPQAARGHLP